ncbi:MAG: hypothetical protein ACXWK8_02540 [Myxococcaceae bacterium]
MRRLLVGGMLGLAMVGGGFALAQSGARPLDDSQPPELTPDDGLGAVRRRMSRHRAMVEALTLATLRLDRPRIAELAAGLERDTGLGTWPGADAGVAARTSLGRLETQLRARSQALAEVAQRGADDALPDAFGRLMETCVQCHAQALPARPGQATAPR